MAFPPNELERYRAALMRGQISPDYAAMPPYAMQNTFDKQAMQGYAGRMSPAMAPPQSVSGGSAGGMAGDMAPDSLLPPEAQAAYDAEQAMKARTQDFTDRQSAVESQREIAQQMRSGKSPEGRTVGPYDVYVAPNWGEVAGDVATKLGGGWLENRANKEGAEIDEARSEAALQKAMEEQRRYKEEQEWKEKEYKVDVDTLNQRIASDAATLAATIENSKRSQAGQNRRDTEEMVYVGEDGKPDYSKTRTAYNSSDGWRWGGKFGNELVDENRWEYRDDPNLTAATSEESRATSAEKVAEYRANTFGDSLKTLKNTMQHYDPTSGQAFVDKYANKSDMLRWASSAEGQQYNSDANTVKEAALRTSTGAAAPNQENSEYMTTLIPGPWDKPSTVDFKMRKLEAIHNRLLELANLPTTTQADLDRAADEGIADARREETAMNVAATKNEGDTWEDATHRYRIFNKELQSEKK